MCVQIYTPFFRLFKNRFAIVRLLFFFVIKFRSQVDLHFLYFIGYVLVFVTYFLWLSEAVPT